MNNALDAYSYQRVLELEKLLLRTSMRFHEMEIGGGNLTPPDEQLWADITAALEQTRSSR